MEFFLIINERLNCEKDVELYRVFINYIINLLRLTSVSMNLNLHYFNHSLNQTAEFIRHVSLGLIS